MKVRVDDGKCQGHTLCAMLAPDSFELSDLDGHANAITAVVHEQRRADVREASRPCLEQAIVIVSDGS
jgi:ferredoxin